PALSWAMHGQVFTTREAGIAPAGTAVRFNFDGYEPQQTGLLLQYVAVQPGARYEVSFWSRRQGRGAETGVELRIRTSPSDTLLRLPARLGRRWRVNRAIFRVPRSTPLVCLWFDYHRPEGQVRLHNAVLLADVQLQRVSP
ncbi:MAG: hypothetical protein ACRD2F_00775, partial [Terriglobales bacterium]